MSSSIKVSAQPRLDPSTKLRQLQEDNEKYRASIESGHMHMQASRIGMQDQSHEGSSMQSVQSYQYKFMNSNASLHAD